MAAICLGLNEAIFCFQSDNPFTNGVPSDNEEDPKKQDLKKKTVAPLVPPLLAPPKVGFPGFSRSKFDKLPKTRTIHLVTQVSRGRTGS